MDRSTQRQKAETFRSLHTAPEILILVNTPDVGSARVVEAAGYPAVATSSAGVAWLLGYLDGEHIPRGQMLDMVRRIATAVQVPVTADIEGGYGRAPETVAETLRLTVEAGAVGINLEDSNHRGTEPLLEVELAAERIQAARAAADGTGVPMVINARTDGFLRREHGPQTLAEAIQRANAYRESGADCLFIPGVDERDTIATLVREINGPVNILVKSTSPPVAELQGLGVARLSVGGLVSLAALALFRRAAEELRGEGTYGFTEGALFHSEMNTLLGSRTGSSGS